MKYRLDIDGLRAVAVLLVIFSHYGFSLHGGFIGVDVFFVISGFVITLAIYPSIKDRTFKISDFWYKRIRRLMPALFMVLSASIIAFSFVLTPSDMVILLKNGIYVLLSVSNFFLWKTYGGYFEGDAQEAPLLHTWSLAVEEQYYLFWPLGLFFLYKIIKGKHLYSFILIALCISTYLSQLGVEKTIAAAYYLMPTRFFELLCGGIIAILFVDKDYRLSSLPSHIASLIGLSLILLSAILLSEASPFPGYNAIYPVVGTALLIISNNGVINKALSYEPIVLIGKMSYSLYLWHWPVLVLLVYTQTDTMTNKIIALALVFIFSYASWEYIEKPFRYKSYEGLGNVFRRLYLTPMVFVLIFCVIGIYLDGFKFRFDDNVIAMDSSLISDPDANKCLSKYKNFDDPISKGCLTKSVDEKGKILLIGDSHANHLRPFLDLMAMKKNYSVVERTLQSCPPIFNGNFGIGQHQYERCKQRNDDIKKHLTNNYYDAVVLAAAWPDSETTQIFNNDGTRITNPDKKNKILFYGLSETVGFISSTGSIPIIIQDTPGTGDVKFSCPIKKAIFNEQLSCIATSKKNEWFSKLIHNIENKSLILVNLRDRLCINDKCRVDINGTPIYRDERHLNKDGSILLAEKYLDEIGNIFDALDYYSDHQQNKNNINL